MTPKEIASAVTRAFEAGFKADKNFGRGSTRTHTWASGWKPCPRAMALDLLHPEDAVFDEQSYARMSFGDVFETDIQARLARYGQTHAEPRFTIEGQQEHFELRGQRGSGVAAGQVVLTGKIDGKIRFEGIRELYPFECKAGQSVQRIRTLEDMFRSPWASRYVYQVLAYLLGTGSPLGFFVLHSGAIPTLVPILLEDHLERAEGFLARAEAAYRSRHGKAPLPAFAANPEHCTRCDHRGKSCSPSWYSGEGPYVSTSPELAELVDEVIENEAPAKAHGSAWKRLQELCRGKKLVLIGEHTITGRPWGKGWRIEIEGES